MKIFLIFAFAVGGCTSPVRNTNGNEDLSVAHDFGGSDVDFAIVPLPTNDGGTGTDDAGSMTHDPVTCDEAAMLKSYIGCDYWPTVNLNAVWSVFDFAVVISNPGMTDAHVLLTGGALPSPSPSPSPIPVTVAPGQLVKIGLPWVNTLKGGDANASGVPPVVDHSVFATNGAYHLVSDVPVLVYQFNALEYKPGAGNDLNGQPWSGCPAPAAQCFSYSNDASLLLPSTAMTGNYIITGVHGDDLTVKPLFGSDTHNTDGPHVAITATVNNTTVAIKLSASASVLASNDAKITAANANDKITYMLNAGDVLELVAKQTGAGSDLTGSQIQASNPVQVISGHPCMPNPQVYTISLSMMTQYTCDHVEEVQLPFETWGKRYVVAAPTGPGGAVAPQTVRIYGGIAGATLTYAPAAAGAPATIAANAVAEFDSSGAFVVSGDHEFAVGVIQKSGQIVDKSANPKGDPSLSFISAVEQYRDRYIFLAPSDYDVNYADVVVPTGTSLSLDNAPVTTTATVIGGGFSLLRLTLTAGANGGSHVLTGNQPFGLQVEGYGAQTSYQYPAGLDLKVIGQPPPPIP